MKNRTRKNACRGLTLLEVLVVIAILFIFVAMCPCAFSNSKRKAQRIQCVNNLKQVGVSFHIWADDHEHKFPMELSETNSGTKEYITGVYAFRHFQIISNELTESRSLFCPAESDRWRVQANTFGASRPTQVSLESNTNLSYFVGVDANATNAAMILAGDHNITNGASIVNGILNVTTNRLAGWTDKAHHRVGNVTMADGSVQQVSTLGLRQIVENSGLATNRLQMP